MDFGLFFLLRSESTGGGVPDSFDRSILRLRPFGEYLESGMALIGTPDEVTRGLAEYCDTTGHRRMLLLMALPGLETAPALSSMRLFVDRVAPAFSIAA
jgi:alkanesulfonate monooxygenase SsuD/methylene tetrahydromethanopterin reductase-like flavin-dependent oxidoreductase (luciferase family)